MSIGTGIGGFSEGMMGGLLTGKQLQGIGLFSQKPSTATATTTSDDSSTWGSIKEIFDFSDKVKEDSEKLKEDLESQQKRNEIKTPTAPQGGMSVDPSQAMSLASSFGGGSSAAGSAGGTATTGAASSAGGASSGIGSMAAAAGPWAGLAAIIGVNEYNAKKGGFRADSDKQYAKDLITGKVASQDINERWAPKVFGSSDKTGLGADAKGIGELSHGNVNGFIDNLKDSAAGKLFKKIF